MKCITTNNSNARFEQKILKYIRYNGFEQISAKRMGNIAVPAPPANKNIDPITFVTLI